MKKKIKKYHTVCTVPKYNAIIVDRSKIDTPSAQIYATELPGLIQTHQYKVAGLI